MEGREKVLEEEAADLLYYIIMYFVLILFRGLSYKCFSPTLKTLIASYAAIGLQSNPVYVDVFTKYVRGHRISTDWRVNNNGLSF